MVKVVVLDVGTLSMATHPAPNAKFNKWLKEVLSAKIELRVPEISDYELRRELIRSEKTNSLAKLDKFSNAVGYVPIDTKAMKLAAEFWADLRNKDQPTADDKSLDADVILAAQAVCLIDDGYEPIVATNNVRHLARLTDADRWENLVVGKTL
ncbi:MAG: hypothetical protein QF511_06825 [Rhodospirillales bacterium]|jgi:predicted nucleic acid-binding protein|nr:hypothetical protein [Rhodospirillales bacterium]